MSVQRTWRLLLAGAAVAAVASCGERRSEPRLADPIVAPESSTRDLFPGSAAKASDFAKVGTTKDFDHLFPRPKLWVEAGALVDSNKRQLTPDDFYRYVVEKLVAEGKSGRNVGDTKPHAMWLQKTMKNLVPASLGARVWIEPFQFLRHRVSPTSPPSLSFSYDRKVITSRTRGGLEFSRLVPRTRHPEVEAFEGSAGGACSGGLESIVAVDNATLQAANAAGDCDAAFTKLTTLLGAVRDDGRRKVAVVRRDPLFHRSAQARVLDRAKACGMIYMSDAGPLIQTGSARNLLEPDVGGDPVTNAGMPLLTMSRETGDELWEAITNSAHVFRSFSMSATVQVDRKTSFGYSVVTWIPGRNADGTRPTAPGTRESVVIGAHFDAFHQGASDNGGGVAMLLALLRQTAIDEQGSAAGSVNVGENEFRYGKDAKGNVPGPPIATGDPILTGAIPVHLSGCTTCAVPNGLGNALRLGTGESDPVVHDFKKGLTSWPDVYFVAFDGEEVGLFGGYTFMLRHVAEIIADRIKLVIDLETPRGFSAGMTDVIGTSSVEPGTKSRAGSSPFMWEAASQAALLWVTFDDANSQIAKPPGYANTHGWSWADGSLDRAPFWAAGNVFEIVRQFGGVFPTDVQGLYRAQLPTMATASQPVTYHTSADTIAREYEASVFQTMSLPSRLDPRVDVFPWVPKYTSIPFKALATYDVLWAYYKLRDGTWPDVTAIDPRKGDLAPPTESARLQITDGGADPDPAVLTCVASKGCDITVRVKPTRGGQTEITDYQLNLLYSNVASVPEDATLYGFDAVDPSQPMEFDVGGKKARAVPAIGTDRTATFHLGADAFAGFTGATPTKFHPWVQITARGTVTSVKAVWGVPNKAIAEMVRPITFKSTPKTCFSTVLEKDAYCPFTDTCQPACLCTEPDPFSGTACLTWLDEWSCTGTTNPFGGCF